MRVVTLGCGLQVGLGAYVAGVKLAKANPDTEFKHGLRGWSHDLNREADSLYNRARQMADVIPFGQPILVGHHSERRDRAYRGRMNRTFERAFETKKTADHYAERAVAATSNTAISSDNPNAVALLREKLAALEADQARMKAINKAHGQYVKKPASLDASTLAENDKALIRRYVPAYSWEPHPFAPYQLSNNSANMKRVRDRIKHLERAEGAESREIEADGYRLVFNAEANRIQFIRSRQKRPSPLGEGGIWHPRRGLPSPGYRRLLS